MQRYSEAVAFFFEYAGYSRDPKKETPTQARRRCARALASAERKAWRAGFSFNWSIDPDTDSSDFSDEKPPWQLYQCAVFDAKGTILASLHGIDFGRDGHYSGDTYARVVEAELAAEALARGR